MNKAILVLVGSALLGVGMSAVADEPMMTHEQMMMIKSMDTNGDGKISKEEYMAYHEKMWMSMKKDSNGMVDAKSMMMQHDAMMKNQSMSKDTPTH
jgi:Ca2+-binding EF-hand superfamily protein